MLNPNCIRIAGDIARVDNAFDIEELCELYVEIIGYNPLEDNSEMTIEEIREILIGFLNDSIQSYR